MNNQDREVPVYLFTGILESGKTSFIRDTLNDPGFSRGEKRKMVYHRNSSRNVRNSINLSVL